MHPRKDPIGAFWARVDKSGDCWIWTGGKRGGYGIVTRDYKSRGAHRHSWELANGPIPEGLVVLHKCDTRACVRPSHLSVGTQADNIADMVAKRRHTHGVATASAKLTEDQVREIRSRHTKGMRPERKTGNSMSELMAEFGISRSQIHAVVTRRSWALVA